jgi:hypothetical protein
MENEEHQKPKPTKEQIKIALKKILDYLRAQKETKDNSVPAEVIIDNAEIPNNKSTFDKKQIENEEHQQPKPTKEQMKIVMAKIGTYQRRQREANEKNIPAEEIISNEEIQNDKSVLDNVQVGNENKKLSKLQREIMKSKIIETARKNPKFKMIMDEAILKSQEKRKQTEIPAFDNEQMLLHFLDKREEVELKFRKELISTEEDLNIIFQNQVMAIEPSLVVSAFAYEELNNTYSLEAKTLIEEIMLRVGYSHVSEALIIDFLNEIIKQKKLQIEKEAFKRKIVWLKK